MNWLPYLKSGDTYEPSGSGSPIGHISCLEASGSTSLATTSPNASSYSESGSKLAEEEPTPVVVVQGFLGTPGVFSWDSHIYKHHSPVEKNVQRRRIFVPGVGPVSSLHDRACELFHALVGGTVDYGAEHSTVHKHERYGRHLSGGLYPRWSKLYPLHFVGHSIGGPTIVKLQHLLAEGFFGEEFHPDMILSISAICAPFRGTQIVYTLGESTTSAPALRQISMGNFLAKIIHILAYISPILPAVLDVHADARRLSYHDIGPSEFLKHLWRCDWAESRDAAPFDMTFEASDEREANGEGVVHPNTFYRSYISIMTGPSTSSISTFDFDALIPKPSFCVLDAKNSNTSHPDKERLEEALGPARDLLGDEYRFNDGVVPVFSQWHPLQCSVTSCQHHSGGPDQPKPLVQPGVWTVTTDHDTNHLSLIPSPIWGSSFQRTFWPELLCWLDEIEKPL